MDQEHVIQVNHLASQASQTGTSSGPPEFTRRKNWSQNVLEELRDIVHVLGSDLCLLYCSPATRECLGYQPTELTGHVFTEFLHVDDTDSFVRDFQTDRRIRTVYRFLRKDGKYVTLESRGHFYKSYFFGTARCVPTETTRMMDRFLDVRMENDRLRQRLQWVKAQASKERACSGEQAPETSESTVESRFEEEDVDELFAAVSHPNVYTLGVLHSFGATESVNLFTGLQFDLGERSRGISMGLEGDLFNTVMPPEMGDEGSNETSGLKMGKKVRARKREEDVDVFYREEDKISLGFVQTVAGRMHPNGEGDPMAPRRKMRSTA
jgi:PAS domain S-box-containing protein